MGSATWDDTPAPVAADNSWKVDDGGNDAGAWKPDEQDDGGFSAENTSKHAGGDFDAAGDGGCRVCHEEGHFARDCPNREGGADDGACFRCGEQGHMKSECTNAPIDRPFDGECRQCGASGHRAADCDQKPCKACGVPGHTTEACEVNRMHAMFADMKIEEVSAEVAWENILTADKEKDVDDIRRAVFAYAKAYPELTLVELEATFRGADFNTYLIAKEQEVSDTHTIVNFQGQPGQKYVLSFQFSPRPRRVKFAEGWPETPEDNIERLAEAGVVMDGFVQKCRNCEQVGHVTSACEEEKREVVNNLHCANCESDSHRARDCTEPRKSASKGCRNCGSEEHMAKECDQPRSAEGVECKSCSEIGHFASDCPLNACRNCLRTGHKSKDCTNERVMKCRNCDEIGHMSKECSQPTDWSRVKCQQCEEYGHTYKRCKQQKKVSETEDDANGGGAEDINGGGDWESGAPASGGGGEWESAPAPASSSGGW